MGELIDREQELVALGAAIASNCVPCIEFHIPQAKRKGLSELQIREAVRIADKVRRVPARMVMQTALAKVDEGSMEVNEAREAGCGCEESRQVVDSDCSG